MSCAFPLYAKDIFLPSRLLITHNGYNYLLSFNFLQVRLREHPNAADTLWLGEDDGVFAETHWSRLEAIAVHANGCLTVLGYLFTVSKACGENWSSLVSISITALSIVRSVSIPEHLEHRVIVHSVSIIHEAETVLSIDHSLVNPELFGINIGIVGIVYEKYTSCNNILAKVRQPKTCILLWKQEQTQISDQILIQQ